MPETPVLVNDSSHQLNCHIEGESYVFSVIVKRDDTVFQLKKLVQSERAQGILKDIDPHVLELWKSDDSKPISVRPSKTLVERIRSLEDLSQFSNNLESLDNLLSIFPTQPPTTHVHIIVKVRATDATRESLLSLPTCTGKRKHEENAKVVINRWRSKRFRAELPTTAELARIVDLPLSNEEKIPIPLERMEELVSSPLDMEDDCTMSDIQLLFRPGYYQYPFDIFFTAVAQAPPIMGTENSFIHFWDHNVRDLLEILVPDGRSIRNNYKHTATASLRPDYGFLVNNLCLFRGVEKAPDSSDDLKKELADNILWTYKPAPYVLGYYAIGPDFTLVAISPPSHGQGRPVVHEIAHANLRLRADRIKNICRLINLAGLFQQLAYVVRSSVAEFAVLEREYGTIEIAGPSVIKAYNSPDKVERVNHLRKIYRLLQYKRVPYVDRLVDHFDTTIILSPRGISVPPENEQELLAALICVLEALEVLHQEPPIFHRDIRWPNIIRQVDDPQQWIIIDWEDAAVPPTKALPHFNPNTHSPLVFKDGHGAEVDMWSVGELIIKCRALDVSLKLVKLGRWIQDAGPSASEALGKIKEYFGARYEYDGVADSHYNYIPK